MVFQDLVVIADRADPAHLTDAILILVNADERLLEQNPLLGRVSRIVAIAVEILEALLLLLVERNVAVAAVAFHDILVKTHRDQVADRHLGPVRHKARLVECLGAAVDQKFFRRHMV